jgi:short-chain fatty acids transporter
MNRDRRRSLERLAEILTEWTERWIPDAFVFALLATCLVFVAARLATPATFLETVDAWGGGFWDLIPFTLQMSLVIITGHVLATSPPIRRLIRRMAAWPRSAPGAVALVAFFAMVSSWFNWGFSLVFSAVLARQIARQASVRVDYRALAAASFLGLGSIWAQGLSGSAALQMATPGALQPRIRDIVSHGGLVPNGIISFAHTIFLWQSATAVVVEIAVVTIVMWLAAPSRQNIRTAHDLGIDLGDEDDNPQSALRDPQSRRPSEFLEYSPILSWIVTALGLIYLARYFASQPMSALNLNTINFAFLLLGILLHGTPHGLMRAVRDATPAVWGVILQFPFYAGIAGVITTTHLNDRIADAFVRLSTPATFPAVVAIYSAVLGVFVPSGGSKWVIEAPYVMSAAHTLQVHLGWVVTSYDLGEALANLVQPFWMIPILAMFRLRTGDVMGYTFIVFAALVPVVLLLVTFLGLTLPYAL